MSMLQGSSGVLVIVPLQWFYLFDRMVFLIIDRMVFHIVDKGNDHRHNSDSQKTMTFNLGSTDLIENSTSSANTIDYETSLVSVATDLQILLSSFLEFVLVFHF